MAEDKRSFILYADLIHTVRKMPKEKAGELFVTILSYVNDENPIVEDMLIDLVFEPIKRQMKRDLQKYEEKKVKFSNAGKASAEAKKAAKELLENAEKDSTKINDVDKRSTNSTVNENVTVTDTVNVTVNEIKENNKACVDFLYELYPAKCPVKNVSTGKGQSCKDKITVLLKSKTKEAIETSILHYLSEQKKAGRYIMNFKTLLNNLPDINQTANEGLKITHVDPDNYGDYNQYLSDCKKHGISEDLTTPEYYYGYGR